MDFEKGRQFTVGKAIQRLWLIQAHIKRYIDTNEANGKYSTHVNYKIGHLHDDVILLLLPESFKVGAIVI